MKSGWWNPAGSKHYEAGRWEQSHAAQYGVLDGWTLKFGNITPSIPGEVPYAGVVDDFLCEQPGPLRRFFTNIPVESLAHKVRLIQVRNPWGSDEMFGGSWSDNDTETWSAHKDVAYALGFLPRGDGTWWMTFEDFVDAFDSIEFGSQD